MPVDCYVARASLLGRRPREGRNHLPTCGTRSRSVGQPGGFFFLPARRRRYDHDCSGRIIGLEERCRWLATSDPFAAHCSRSRRRGDSHRDRDTPDAPPRCWPPSGSAPTLCWVTPIGFAAPEYWGAEWRPIFQQRDPLNFWQRREWFSATTRAGWTCVSALAWAHSPFECPQETNNARRRRGSLSQQALTVSDDGRGGVLSGGRRRQATYRPREEG